jgi:hypothetical protein
MIAINFLFRAQSPLLPLGSSGAQALHTSGYFCLTHHCLARVGFIDRLSWKMPAVRQHGEAM